MSLAQKIVQIRKTKGYSQEELSNKANISLRTLQRIEKGETEPRGHTLRAIAEVLEVPVEEMMDFTKKEDTGFLQVMSLSSLSYFFLPLLNILIPLVLWLSKKEKIQDVDTVGRQIISFQIIWSILTYGIPIGASIGFLFNLGVNLEEVATFVFILPLALYFINAVFILISVLRIKRRKEWIFFIPLKFI